MGSAFGIVKGRDPAAMEELCERFFVVVGIAVFWVMILVFGLAIAREILVFCHAWAWLGDSRKSLAEPSESPRRAYGN